MLPYLKLVSSDCTIYFHLEKRKRNEEWVNSSIEIYDNDYLVKSVKPLWYYCEPASLLAAIKGALENHTENNHYKLMDDSTVEFSFVNENNELVLRLYRSFELQDHLTFYMDANQLGYLVTYLSLYIGKFNKYAKGIKELYDKGILQGG